jgi:3-methyladenine DNA glycosylase AlkD
MLEELKKELQEVANFEKAKILQRFFKTGKGEYGEGDTFLGIKVPVQRQIASKYLDLGLYEIQKLLDSEIHEHRLVALLILMQKGGYLDREIFRFYLDNSQKINNWDLVDLSAPQIVGGFILKNPSEKQVIYDLANSNNLWKKRIAIVSTYAFIKQGQFNDTLAIAKSLLNDSHDLIHKAVGWMLREVGKKNEIILEDFLKIYYKNMPRTMLRYAIEKFDEEKRKGYLLGKI